MVLFKVELPSTLCAEHYHERQNHAGSHLKTVERVNRHVSDCNASLERHNIVVVIVDQTQVTPTLNPTPTKLRMNVSVKHEAVKHA